MGLSTSTTAFDGTIWYFSYTMWTHEGVLFRKNNFWQKDSRENLDIFSILGLLYMHWWCLHGSINVYHSFWWNNMILCLYNVDTLNICMKEFGSEKITFDKNIHVITWWWPWGRFDVQMREIRVSMREIFRSYRKVYLNDLLKSLTPFILVDYPIHNDIISME